MIRSVRVHRFPGLINTPKANYLACCSGCKNLLNFCTYICYQKNQIFIYEQIQEKLTHGGGTPQL